MIMLWQGRSVVRLSAIFVAYIPAEIIALSSNGKTRPF